MVAIEQLGDRMQRLKEQSADLQLRNAIQGYAGKLDADGQQMLRDIKMKMKAIEDWGKDMPPQYVEMAKQALVGEISGKQGLFEVFRAQDDQERYTKKYDNGIIQHRPPGGRWTTMLDPDVLMDPQRREKLFDSMIRKTTLPDKSVIVESVDLNGNPTVQHIKTADANATKPSYSSPTDIWPEKDRTAYYQFIGDLLKVKRTIPLRARAALPASRPRGAVR